MNVYLHFPFCASKCRYCAFYSLAGAEGREMRDWIRLVAREAELRGFAGREAGTVYVGGGTPSLLGPAGVRALFATLPFSRRIPAGPEEGFSGPETETTVETNPADVTPELARAMAEAGVNRVSVGAQSFSERTLRWLGRRHGSAEIRSAVSAVRAAGIPQLSLDLIAAVPGEPTESFSESLRSAVALGPDHVSVYPLSVEPGTPLAAAGTLPPGADAALSSVAEAESFLSSRGYARYELSNYARPGAECRHNTAVWLGEDYSGFGPGAHSREGRVRRANAPDFAAWRDALKRGRIPPATVETASPEEDEAERFVMRIRLARWSVPDTMDPAMRRRLRTLRALAANGLVFSPAPGEWSLTARGREVADSVMAELV